MAQDGSEASGVYVGYGGQIYNRVPNIGQSNRILEIKERLQCQRALDTKNRCFASRSRRAQDLNVFHSSRFYYEPITIL